MICSYLYQYVGFAMDAAIEAFTASRCAGARFRPPKGRATHDRRKSDLSEPLCRPPGIYKPYYIQELLRSGGMSPDTVQAPPYPDWDTPDSDEAVAGVKRTRSGPRPTRAGVWGGCRAP